ncbi:hypothetical protein J2S43_008235 [Catenuloplanes nepalensis]|uniref:DUF1996 domain-containing protein n=1 Tax=Catenuloplanes nepalensis TaxID=587533 RepID=A0ABT9N7Q7_9ACTN|nr:DUF1996 domain-containing protein [Catenuloplanes nepalensis]MDP9799723.1 hypothetical protein [Catenuloplanes nepalensis]
MSDLAPRPGLLRRLAVNKRNLAASGAGVAVVVIAVAAAAVSLADASAEPDPAGAATVASPSTVVSATGSPSASPSASASASASASPSAVAPAKPVQAAPEPVIPKTGWIAVDSAAWKAQVDAYQALSYEPAPASVGNLPEFRADCEYSHSLPDDPIVAPGLPGASHMHSFFGNEGVDAGTVADDLVRFTATTCEPKQDHSSYWVPTLYDAGTNKAAEPTGFRVYYRSLMNDSAKQLPMPNGLRMIAGDAKKKVPTPRGATGQFYCAYWEPGHDADGVARSTDGNWPICEKQAYLHFILQFPDCWDGRHLDSPNHKDHVAYGWNNACPASHPVKIPAITFDIQYGVQGSQAGYYLASDKDVRSSSSMHGDAFVMWDVDTMNKRTKNCVEQRRTCDNYGYLK